MWLVPEDRRESGLRALGCYSPRVGLGAPPQRGAGQRAARARGGKDGTATQRWFTCRDPPPEDEGPLP